MACANSAGSTNIWVFGIIFLFATSFFIIVEFFDAVGLLFLPFMSLVIDMLR